MKGDGAVSGTLACGVGAGPGSKGSKGRGADRPSTGCATGVDCNGCATGAAAGSVAEPGAGASMMRSSGTSMRRSCQGKPKPGSPLPWPPKVRLSSSACTSRDSSSATVMRLRSVLLRQCSGRPGEAPHGEAAGSGAGAATIGAASAKPVCEWLVVKSGLRLWSH